MKRICEVCGRQVNAGMTAENSSFYCHEECFGEYMNNTFGEHKWMNLGGYVEDEFGGYYLVADDSEEKGFRGTGIYYTEWEDDDDGEDE